MRRITTALFLLFIVVQSFAQQRSGKELPIIADYTPNVAEEMFKSNKHSNMILAEGDDRWNMISGDPNATGIIYAISDRFHGRRPFIGGAFDSIHGVRARGIAGLHYQDDTSIVEIGGGVDGVVYAIYESDYQEFYIGGQFSKAGSVDAKNLAYWNGKEWESFGVNIDSTILSVLKVGDNLYIGGNFRHVDSIAANYIARFNLKTKSWEPIVIDGINGVDGGVAILKNDYQGNIYVGGGFVKAGNTVVNKIAKFNGSIWSEIDGGVTGSNSFVSAIGMDSYDLKLIGGSFSKTGNVNSANIGSYDWGINKWESIGQGTDGPVYAINYERRPIVVGGDFRNFNGIEVNNITGAPGFQEDLGSLGAWGSGLNGAVYALSGEYRVLSFNVGISPVFVGGNFSTAGGKPSHFLAVYEGPEPTNLEGLRTTNQFIKIYPSPASTSVTIELPIDASSLLITDAIGRTVKVFQTNQGEDIKVDVSHLPIGMYNAILKSKDGVSVATFVVAR